MGMADDVRVAIDISGVVENGIAQQNNVIHAGDDTRSSSNRNPEKGHHFPLPFPWMAIGQQTGNAIQLPPAGPTTTVSAWPDNIES